MRLPVLVSVPNTGWIHKLVCTQIDRILADTRFSVRLIRPTHRPYENNQHHIIRNLLSGDEEYWLNIDSDNPPQRNPLDLVSLKLDIVGLPTPVMHYTKPGESFYYWNAYKKVPKGYTEWPVKSGLQEVDAVGSGCVLYSRHVFEHARMGKAPFRRTTDKCGRVVLGNDLAFCQRARACGFSIWAHYDYPCDHIHEIPLQDMIKGHVGVLDNG